MKHTKRWAQRIFLDEQTAPKKKGRPGSRVKMRPKKHYLKPKNQQSIRIVEDTPDMT